MIIYILCGVALFLILTQVLKFFIFLYVAIGRTKEQKKAERVRAKDIREAEFQRRCIRSQEWIMAQNPEEIKIEGFRGVMLTGHFIPAKDQKRIVLAFHGWRSNWKKDFAFCAQKFLEQGCSVLLVEQRAHGRSGGKHIGFGILERFDCVKWTEFLHEKYGNRTPVYLYGVSMGASTVLMASSLALPGNVKGIIADCGFTTPYLMIVRFANKILKRGEFPEVPIVNKLCKWLAGYDFKEYSTLEALKECKLPILFIHGKKDEFVPYSMTLDNFKQCKSRKELFLVEGADHCRCFYIAPDEYMRKIQQFFQWKTV